MTIASDPRPSMFEGMYILDGLVPKPCHNAREWGEWMYATERHILFSECEYRHPELSNETYSVRVSTVFLGMDVAAPFDRGEPKVFETMVWLNDEPKHLARAASVPEAVEAHKASLREADSQFIAVNICLNWRHVHGSVTDELVEFLNNNGVVKYVDSD